MAAVSICSHFGAPKMKSDTVSTLSPSTCHEVMGLDAMVFVFLWGLPGGSNGKASACSVGDLGLIPGLGRSPGEGNGNPLQYSCLENPMDGGAWWVTVHGVAKSWTRLSDFTFTLCDIMTLFAVASILAKRLQG